MSDSLPWGSIGVPGVDFNVRLVAAQTVVPCYWGRDANGAFLFIVELFGDCTEQYRKDHVLLHGINVALRSDEAAKQLLVLTLEKQVDVDLFNGLCQTLVVALQKPAEPTSAFSVTLMHLRRWKAFLAGRPKRLSAEEIRGLFSELSFLLELLANLPATVAVNSWLGADRSQQDFVFNNTAVEIKSVSGSERNSVRISSENQLATLNDSLFLRLYRLDTDQNTESSRSLNDIVAEVQEKLDEAGGIELFEQKLAKYGYAPFPEYDEPLFVVREVTTYSVNGRFPRLIRSQIPSGLVNVSYDIQLESIGSFRCNNNTVFGGGSWK